MSSKLGNTANIGTAVETASPHHHYGSDPRIAGSLDIVALISLHFKLIVSTILGGMILATIAAYTLPEEFTASATLVFERTDTRFSQAEEMLKTVDFSEVALNTELDIMRSRVLLEKLVDSLELMNDPSLNPYIVPKEGRIEDSPESTIRSQREFVISALDSAISVKREAKSLTTIVSVTHPDPNQAAKIANAIVDTYASNSLQLKRNELLAAAKAVGERTALMEKRIAETEGAIADHLKENQTDGVGSGNLREDRLRSGIAQVQSQLKVLQQQQTGEEKSSSPQLQLLNVKLAELTDELHQLVVADMQYRTLTEKLETYRSQRNRLVDQIVTLQAQADLQKPGVRVISHATVPTDPSFPRRKMIIAAGFVGSFFLALLLPFLVEELFGKVRSEQRLMQITGVPNLVHIPELGPRVRIKPADFLKRSHYAAAMRSFFELGPRVRIKPADFLKRSHYAAAMRSFFELGPRVRIKPVDYLKAHPRSHYAATMRSFFLCADIFEQHPTTASSQSPTNDISSTTSSGGKSTITRTQDCLTVENNAIEDDRRPKVVAISSPLPGEGKSTFSIGLGITAARLGLKVILVDLDLHFGGVSTIVEVRPGDRRLEAFLRGEASLEESVVAIDPEVPGLDIIASAPASMEPSTLLHSARPRLSQMFHALKRNYDLVIVDTPPQLVVDDMSLVGDWLDDVFLVVRWGKTTERAMADVVRRLRLTKAPLSGTVINGANPRGGYGYAYHSYYTPVT